mmetsp:Transcript_23435/g.34059  ORF Transcript_23435/g.34059 Transcript_23435/m.34059 type:complete len:217 (+) Transcript_23435:361-1011(+)
MKMSGTVVSNRSRLKIASTAKGSSLSLESTGSLTPARRNGASFLPLLSAAAIKISLASGSWPLDRSHLGDVGIKLMDRRVMAEGTVHSATSHLHPRVSSTAQAMATTVQVPMPQAICVADKTTLLTSVGTISASMSYGTQHPPTPNPTIIWRRTRIRKLGASAESRPKVVMMVMVTVNILFLPCWSDNGPQSNPPAHSPIKIAPASKDFSAGPKFQ